MAKASRISSNFGSDTKELSPHIPAKEKEIHLQSSTVCRYYAAGRCRHGSACRFVHLHPERVPQEYAYPNEHGVRTRICHYYTAGHCQRGSACHFVHSPPESVPQEYAYPNGHGVHMRAPHKWYDQYIGHSHGYAAYAIYAVAPHVAPYGFDARHAVDNSSDISSLDSTPSDQSLNAAFEAMTIKEPVSSEYLPSAFSQSSPSLQYPNNTGTRYSNVACSGYTPTGLKPRAATRRKAEQGKEKQTLYRTKPCKFFSAGKTCRGGNKCRFIHEVEKSKLAKKADNQARGTAPSHLPPKPCSLQEETKARDYYPITWRVIGGGVMMGLPCKAFAAGYCPDGKDCRLARETEVWTTENGVVQLKTETSATSVAAPSSSKSLLDSNAKSQRQIVSTDCSGSSCAIDDIDGSTSGGTSDADKFMSAANSNTAVPSQHRRTRSMSMPTSPSVLGAPHIFAEL